MEHWKKELKKKESFKLGTPAIYSENNKEMSGEVILNPIPVKISKTTYKKGEIKGISLYKNENYSGDSKLFIVPDTWLQVRGFHTKVYKKTHRQNAALKTHIQKITERGGGYTVKANTIRYWF